MARAALPYLKEGASISFRRCRLRGQHMPRRIEPERMEAVLPLAKPPEHIPSGSLAAWHPSYVLHMRDDDARERTYAELVADLRLVTARLAAG